MNSLVQISFVRKIEYGDSILSFHRQQVISFIAVLDLKIGCYLLVCVRSRYARAVRERLRRIERFHSLNDVSYCFSNSKYIERKKYS